VSRADIEICRLMNELEDPRYLGFMGEKLTNHQAALSKRARLKLGITDTYGINLSKESQQIVVEQNNLLEDAMSYCSNAGMKIPLLLRNFGLTLSMIREVCGEYRTLSAQQAALLKMKHLINGSEVCEQLLAPLDSGLLVSYAGICQTFKGPAKVVNIGNHVVEDKRRLIFTFAKVAEKTLQMPSALTKSENLPIQLKIKGMLPQKLNLPEMLPVLESCVEKSEKLRRKSPKKPKRGTKQYEQAKLLKFLRKECFAPTPRFKPFWTQSQIGFRNWRCTPARAMMVEEEQMLLPLHPPLLLPEHCPIVRPLRLALTGRWKVIPLEETQSPFTSDLAGEQRVWDWHLLLRTMRMRFRPCYQYGRMIPTFADTAALMVSHLPRMLDYAVIVDASMFSKLKHRPFYGTSANRLEIFKNERESLNLSSKRRNLRLDWNSARLRLLLLEEWQDRIAHLPPTFLMQTPKLTSSLVALEQQLKESRLKNLRSLTSLRRQTQTLQLRDFQPTWEPQEQWQPVEDPLSSLKSLRDSYLLEVLKNDDIGTDQTGTVGVIEAALTKEIGQADALKVLITFMMSEWSLPTWKDFKTLKSKVMTDAIMCVDYDLVSCRPMQTLLRGTPVQPDVLPPSNSRKPRRKPQIGISYLDVKYDNPLLKERSLLVAVGSQESELNVRKNRRRMVRECGRKLQFRRWRSLSPSFRPEHYGQHVSVTRNCGKKVVTSQFGKDMPTTYAQICTHHTVHGRQGIFQYVDSVQDAQLKQSFFAEVGLVPPWDLASRESVPEQLDSMILWRTAGIAREPSLRHPGWTHLREGLRPFLQSLKSPKIQLLRSFPLPTGLWQEQYLTMLPMPKPLNW
jgi:hypothetical protein